MPDNAQSSPLPYAKLEAKLETEQRRRVLDVAKAVSATIGNDFFQSLARHLASSLEADYICVEERAKGPNGLITLASYGCGVPNGESQQSLPGTAFYHVLEDGQVAWSAGVRQIFPLDALLESIEAEGFVGVRLCDSAGQVIGLVAAASKRRMRNAAVAKSILETFAPRAAAELERKRADDVLRESEERHRAFIAHNSEAMWRIELETPIPLQLPEEEQIERVYRYGYVAECNNALARQLGRGSPEELVGMRFGELFPPSDARIREELKSAVRSGYSAGTYSTTPVSKDGVKSYLLRTQCGIVENNELRRIWGTTRDITALKRAELVVAASERRFREVLKSVQLPAVMLDTAFGITFCNDHLLRLAHWRKEEVSGKNWLEAIGAGNEREQWVALTTASPKAEPAARHFEGAIAVHGRTPRLIAWDTTILRDEDGAFTGIAALGRDITDQKEIEARTSLIDKLESIGRLTAGVAHDFNNLLMLVIGQTQILLERVPAADPVRAGLEAIDAAAGECANLTRHLLAIGRKQQLRPELIDLNAVIAGEETIIRGVLGKQIELIKDFEPHLGLVYADAVQIRRVLANLVTNARDAMPDGGVLTLSTANIEVGAEEIAVPSDLTPGRYVRLSVADTGSGLSEEVKVHMFEPFYTTKAPGVGTGLGLPTVYGIVVQSGGRVAAKSKPGMGTTIEILLPRHRAGDTHKKA